MLFKMLARAFRAPPAASPAPPQAAAPPATVVPPAPVTGPEAEFQRLRGSLQALCAAGHCRDAAMQFDHQARTPDTPQEAQRSMRELVLPILEGCERVGDAETACKLEELAYGRLIRAFEEPAHYEACFGPIDAALYRLGQRAAKTLPPQPKVDPSRLLFFVHNLGNDRLAHVQLLADLLEAHLEAQPQDAPRIGIAGCVARELAPRIRRLVERWSLQAWTLPTSTAPDRVLSHAAELAHTEGYGRLVVVSVPVGISFLTGLLEERVAWLSMKFELACFDRLRHRCSFIAGERQHRVIAGRDWWAAPPLFSAPTELVASGQVPDALRQARRFGTVFYTINREEKIRNPLFLDAVAAILQRVPDSGFVWTGRHPQPAILEHFASRGLADRQFFAGWVVPDDLLAGADIFLDTPVLSGAVAARAVAVGCPVLTWSDSRSWINFFLPTYRRRSELSPTPAIQQIEARGLALECATPADYVDQAVRLAVDPALRADYGVALRAFAAEHFFDRGRSAGAHLANLRSEPLAA